MGFSMPFWYGGLNHRLVTDYLFLSNHLQMRWLITPAITETIRDSNMSIINTPFPYREGTEKVDNTVYIWYNVSIKYRRCFYDRTTAEIGAKSIHGNI